MFIQKTKKKPSLKFTKGLFAPAIVELGIALDTMKTNEPINRREGNIEQANLEHENALSFGAAIKLLRSQK